MSSPNTTIQLYAGVPLDNTYNNVIRGGLNASILNPYLIAKWKNQTYTRIYGLRGNKVRLETGYGNYSDEYFNCNYISITNMGAKTFYGFITDILYINDNVMEVQFEIDVFHTFYNDYLFGECIIERTNVDDYTVLTDYTMKEPVELGNEYRVINLHTVDLSDCDLIVAVTQPTAEQGIVAQGGMYNVGVDVLSAGRTNLNEMVALMSRARTQQKLTSYYAPKMFEGSGIYSDNFSVVLGTYADELDGYTPTNKKLLTYPYRYLEVTNMQGQSQIYKIENFGTTYGITFQLYGTAFPAPYAYLCPRYYQGYQIAFDFGIPIQSFASNVMSSDTMSYYWATHKNQILLNTAGQGISMASTGAVTGAMTGGLVGASIGAGVGLASGLVGNSMKSIGEIHDIGQQSSKYIGVGSSDGINVVSGHSGYNINLKTIRKEYAQAADNFLTRYGYSYKKIGTPPISGNYVHKYIKTDRCNLKSHNMPTWAASLICNIHDNGVTYWNALSSVGNYS